MISKRKFVSIKQTLLFLILFATTLFGNEAEKLWFSAKANLGYYSQDFSTLQFDKTVQEEMERIHPFKYQELRGTLAKFMFTEKQLVQKVGELSEGQKARIQKILSKVKELDPKADDIEYKAFTTSLPKAVEKAEKEKYLAMKKR